MKTLLTILTLVFVTMSHNPANARGLDIEIDPLAYALNGYSLHLGFNTDMGRFDLGVFGLELDESLLETTSISSEMKGVGVKWDFITPKQSGVFAGLEAI